jgi:hypothetical protein
MADPVMYACPICYDTGKRRRYEEIKRHLKTVHGWNVATFLEWLESLSGDPR